MMLQLAQGHPTMSINKFTLDYTLTTVSEGSVSSSQHILWNNPERWKGGRESKGQEQGERKGREEEEGRGRRRRKGREEEGRRGGRE